MKGNENRYFFNLLYLDVSLGKQIATVNTETGAKINSMRQNPHNAIIHCGFQDGTVGLYSPNQTKGSLVKFLAMREPLNSIAVNNGGRYIACAGTSKRVNIFDLRNSYRPVCEHFLGGGSQNLKWSDGGLLACSYSNRFVSTYENAHVAPMRKLL